MPYMAAIGLDNEDDLVRLVPQGKTEDGIKSSGRTYAPAGVYPEGEYYVDLLYTVLERAEKQTLDAAFGVSEDVLRSECTVQLLKNDDTWGNFNAWVEYPEIGKNAKRSQFGWDRVVYRIHIIEELV